MMSPGESKAATTVIRTTAQRRWDRRNAGVTSPSALRIITTTGSSKTIPNANNNLTTKPK